MTGFQITDISTPTLTLKWNQASAEVQGYALYRQCTGEGSFARLGTLITTTTYISYIDTPPDMACSYRVSPVNLAGIETDNDVVPTHYKIFLASIVKR